MQSILNSPHRPLGRTIRAAIFGAVLSSVSALSASATAITWTGAANDGSWQTQSNWDLNRVPAAGDDVVIPDLANTALVSFASGATTVESIDCDEAFAMAGGTLEVVGLFSSSKSLTVQNGALTGSGNIEPAGAFSFTGGSIGGTGTLTVPSGLSWSLAGNSAPVLSRTLINQGEATATFGNGFGLSITSDGTFRNATGAVVRLQALPAIGGFGTFINEAGALVEQSSTTTNFEWNVGSMTNDGTLDLQTGSFRFRTNATNAGLFKSSAGTSIAFTTGTFTFPAGGSFAPDGEVSFEGGVVSFDPASSFVPGGTVAVRNSTITIPFDVAFPRLDVTGGALNGDGDFTIENTFNFTGGSIGGAGTLTIPAGVSWALAGNSAPTLSRPLINEGEVTATFGNGFGLSITSGVTFRNATGAVVRLQALPAIGGFGTFINEAGALVEQSSTTTNFEWNVGSMTNDGTLDLQTGSFRFRTNATNAGLFKSSAGTSIAFTTGTFTFPAGGSFAPDGEVSFEGGVVSFDPASSFVPGGTVAVRNSTITIPFDVAFPRLDVTGGALNGDGDFTIENTFNFTGGSIGGAGTLTIPAGVSWALAGNSAPTLSRPLINEGEVTATFGNGFGLSITSGVTFRNADGGIIHLRSLQGFHGQGSFINEEGALIEQSSVSSGFPFSTSSLRNDGAVEVRSGTVEFSSSLQNLSGGTLTGGSYLVVAALRFDGGDLVTNAASLTLDGPSASVQKSGGADGLANFSVNASDGSLSLVHGANLALSHALSNAGSIEIHDTSRLDANGGFAQSDGTTKLDGGTLHVPSTLALNGGTLVGNGTIDGNLSNAAEIAPGASPGHIDVSGNYTQTITGRLRMEVGGTIPGTGHDLLTVGSTASLGGSLEITVPDGFVPPPEIDLDLITAASITTAFDDTNLPLAYIGGCMEGIQLPSVFRVHTHAAPGFVQGPESVNACPGDSVSFTVVLADDFDLQWQKNGEDLPGETSTTLIINPVSEEDEGSYAAVITNTCGVVSSSPATLTVDVCGAPVGACCLPDGSCGVESAESCNGTYEGDGSSCEPNPCPQPIVLGACCAIDGGCLLVAQADCSGTYQGDGTVCDPNPCPQPIVLGACCAGNGGCTLTRRVDCTGSYQGDNTVCVPNPCPQPSGLGACCVAVPRLGSLCFFVTPAFCARFPTGHYLGDGTFCRPNPCNLAASSPEGAVELGACCLANGDCIALSIDDCAAIEGRFGGVGSSCEDGCGAAVPTERTSWGKLKARY